MRKFTISLLLTLIISPSTLAAFTDVSQNHPNITAIEYLQETGIIGGYADGSFRPNGDINRAEMMKILVEGQGISPDVITYQNCFPDVGTEWFARYVCYAKEQNWVGGYPDGTFKPANNVLDVEALKMILNAKGFEIDLIEESVNFPNISPNAWFYPFLVIAEGMSLIDIITPGKNYTRAEVSEVIFRSIAIESEGVGNYSEGVQLEFLAKIPETPQQLLEPAKYELYTPEKRAKYEGKKPFTLFFHAQWCSICKRIETELKTNLASYPDGFTILEIDYDTQTELRQEFGVTRQYWFVVFDAEGNMTFSNNLFSAEDVVEEIGKSL